MKERYIYCMYGYNNNNVIKIVSPKMDIYCIANKITFACLKLLLNIS